MASQDQQSMPFGYAIQHMQEPEPAQAPQPTGSPLLDHHDSSLLASFWDRNHPYSDDPIYDTDNFDFLDSEQLNAAALGLAPSSHDFSFPEPSFMTDQAHVKQSFPPLSRQSQLHQQSHTGNAQAQAQAQSHAPSQYANPRSANDSMLDDSQIGASALFNLANARPTSATTGYGLAYRDYENKNGMSSALNMAQYPLSNPGSSTFSYSSVATPNNHRPGQPLPFGSDQSFRSHARPSPDGQMFSFIDHKSQYSDPSRPSTAYTMGNGQGPDDGAIFTRYADSATSDRQVKLEQELSTPTSAVSVTKGKKRAKAASRTPALAAISTNTSGSPTVDAICSPISSSAVQQSASPAVDTPLTASSTTTMTTPTAGASSQHPRKRRKSSNATAAAARPRLTEEQKKERHIHSEQKRRDQIKDRFADLNGLVPGLRSGGFSKAAVLQETVRFLDCLVVGNRRAEEALAAVGS